MNWPHAAEHLCTYSREVGRNPGMVCVDRFEKGERSQSLYEAIMSLEVPVNIKRAMRVAALEWWGVTIEHLADKPAADQFREDVRRVLEGL